MKIKNIFKLLLVIIMVTQPVSFSYAMASMALGSHAASSVSSSKNMHAMNGAMTEAHEQSTHKGGSESGGCCQSTVCSPASVVSVVTVVSESKSQVIGSTAVILTSIDLPTEIKPPRSLPG